MSRSTPKEITPIQLHMSIFYYLLSDVYDENRLLPVKVHSFQGQQGAQRSLETPRVYSSLAVAVLHNSNQTVSFLSIVNVKGATASTARTGCESVTRLPHQNTKWEFGITFGNTECSERKPLYVEQHITSTNQVSHWVAGPGLIIWQRRTPTTLLS